MINLLPPERAALIRYARQNTVLRKWLIGCLVAVAGLVCLLISGWFYINQQAQSLQQNINASNQQLKNQDLDKVQSNAKEISGDIRVINQVLSSEIRFSDLIQDIGQDMPPGTILGSLSLSKVSGTIDLSASAKNYADAAQVAANLSDPSNGLFSSVDVLDVTCGNSLSNGSAYDCSASFEALFSSTAQTKFLGIPKEDHS